LAESTSQAAAGSADHPRANRRVRAPGPGRWAQWRRRV